MATKGKVKTGRAKAGGKADTRDLKPRSPGRVRGGAFIPGGQVVSAAVGGLKKK